MCHTFLEIPKKGFFMKLCSAHFALMINLLRKIQGPALELPQRGRARVDPFYGAPEAPEGTSTQSANCPRSSKLHGTRQRWLSPVAHGVPDTSFMHGGQEERGRDRRFMIWCRPHLLREGGRAAEEPKRDEYRR